MPDVVSSLSAETIGALVKAIQTSGDLRKAITTANGPQAYDLEPEVKSLFPVNTPLRNDIPRVFSRNKGDVATHWQAYTGINTTWQAPVVFEGRRAGTVSSTKVNYTAPYATFGLEDSVTEEARLAAVGYDDVDARTVANLIWALMITEEVTYLGGNNSLAMGTAGTPVLASVAPAAGEANSAFAGGGENIYVRAVGLTLEGYQRAIRNGNVPVATVTRTVVGATLAAGPVQESLPGGTTAISAEATVATASHEYINASVANIKGIVAWAWYVGSVAGKANLRFHSLTTINSVHIADFPAGGSPAAGALFDADQSYYNNNPIGVDGIITFVAKPGNNATYTHLPTGTAGTGTALTAGKSANILDIDTLFLSMWNSWQGGPDTIWVNAQELGNISDKVFSQGSAAPILRMIMDIADPQIRTAQMRALPAGVVVGFLLNKYTMGGPTNVAVKIHPYLPPGTILAQTHRLPFPNANVPDVLRVRGQLDYHEISWGPFTRSGEYGVYFRGTLQCYFPPGFAVLSNVGNG